MRKFQVISSVTCFVLVAGLQSGCGRPTVPVTLDPAAVGQAEANRTDGSSHQQPEVVADGFRFPDDRGGKLLAHLLPPAPQASRLPSDQPAVPVRFATPRSLERRELPLPTSEAAAPNLAPVARRVLRPRALAEGLPLADFRGDPLLPQRAELPAGDRTREWSLPVNEPLALPFLAQKQGEAAGSEDATGDASLAAALANAPPRRHTPAPFLRLTLPDPFEHRRSARLQKELAEPAFPVSGPARLPQP